MWEVQWALLVEPWSSPSLANSLFKFEPPIKKKTYRSLQVLRINHIRLLGSLLGAFEPWPGPLNFKPGPGLWTFEPWSLPSFWVCDLAMPLLSWDQALATDLLSLVIAIKLLSLVWWFWAFELEPGFVRLLALNLNSDLFSRSNKKICGNFFSRQIPGFLSAQNFLTSFSF